MNLNGQGFFQPVVEPIIPPTEEEEGGYGLSVGIIFLVGKILVKLPTSDLWMDFITTLEE